MALAMKRLDGVLIGMLRKQEKIFKIPGSFISQNGSKNGAAVSFHVMVSI
jgi:hypothetical protein